MSIYRFSGIWRDRWILKNWAICQGFLYVCGAQQSNHTKLGFVEFLLTKCYRSIETWSQKQKNRQIQDVHTSLWCPEVKMDHIVSNSASQSQRRWISKLIEFTWIYCKASTSNFKTSLQQLACHFMLGGAVFKSHLVKFHCDLWQIVVPLSIFKMFCMDLYGFVLQWQGRIYICGGSSASLSHISCKQSCVSGNHDLATISQLWGNDEDYLSAVDCFDPPLAES